MKKISESKTGLYSNIWKLYVIRFLTWFMVIMPIIVLFYQEKGLSLQEIFIIQAFFSFCIVAFEVPSGYLADNWGRKRAIVLGCVFLTTGYTAYIFASGFFHFLFAEILLGIGASFVSGADSALLYDSLLESGKDSEYQKVEGKIHSLSSFSEGLASILGGFLAVISLTTPVIAEACALALSVPVALSLKETTIHKAHATDTSWAGIWKAVKFSIHDHKEIKWLIIYAALIGASTFTMVWFIQPYFKLIDLPIAWFGIAWAGLQFSIAFFALFSKKYEDLLGRKASLISLIFFPVLAYVLVALTNSLWGLLCLLPFYIVRGIKEPILKDYINKLVPSHMRATVLSVRSMMMRACFVVIGPFVGWIADIYTLQTALLWAAFIFFASAIIALLGLRAHKAL